MERAFVPRLCEALVDKPSWEVTDRTVKREILITSHWPHINNTPTKVIPPTYRTHGLNGYIFEYSLGALSVHFFSHTVQF